MDVLFVPSIGLPESLLLLDRLADSVDFPIKWRVVMNNGITGTLEPFRESHPGWIVREPITNNLGVAGSWNACAAMFPDAPTYLLMNEDSWFFPGQLEELCKCADANIDAPLIHINDTNAYYCFVATRSGREKFGTFDENIWCAYYEDVEMRYRHRLGGVTTYPYAMQDREPVPHGKSRSGGDNYSALINGCGLFNRAYMMRKWGCFDQEMPIYQTPYNDHRLAIKDWIWMPEERAKRFPLWDTFMSLLNPSIYD